MTEATFLSDLWGDRRVRQGAFDGPDRRSGIDRRVARVDVDTDRRSRTVSRQLWRSGHLERLALIASDSFALIVALAFAWAVTVRPQVNVSASELSLWWHTSGAMQVSLHLAFAGAAVLVFWLIGHYSKRTPFWDELPSLIKIIVAAACLDATFVFLGQWNFSRGWLLGTWGIALFTIPLLRMLTKHTMISMGGWMRPTVIIGTGQNALETAHALRSEPMLGFQLMGFMVTPQDWSKEGMESDADLPRILQVGEHRLPVYRMRQNPEATLNRLGRPHVVVALDKGNPWGIAEMLHKAQDSYSSLNIVPSLRGLPLVGTEIMHFFRHEVLLLQVQNNLARRMPQRVKRAFDMLASAALLLLLSPLFLVVSLMIAFNGTSPFFGHTRVGQEGRPFKCYKFQSMVANADEVLRELLAKDPEARAEWEQNFKLKDDPRVTRIGAFLRRTSLDELPQLWNVFKGEMSLVGPRPVVKSELDRYADHVSYYLKAKPGITGLWQISGRSDASYEERVALDVWYAKNWTLWYDIVILLKTAREVLFARGAY